MSSLNFSTVVNTQCDFNVDFEDFDDFKIWLNVLFSFVGICISVSFFYLAGQATLKKMITWR